MASILRSAFVIGAFTMLLGPMPASGNGVDFFEDARTPGPDPLLYYGRITDQQGKPLSRVQVYVAIRRLSILIETHARSDGTYETHDLVKALEMIGEKVDPAQLELYVVRNGYRQAIPKTRAVPKEKRGRIKVDFVMVPR